MSWLWDFARRLFFHKRTDNGIKPTPCRVNRMSSAFQKCRFSSFSIMYGISRECFYGKIVWLVEKHETTSKGERYTGHVYMSIMLLWFDVSSPYIPRYDVYYMLPSPFFSLQHTIDVMVRYDLYIELTVAIKLGCLHISEWEKPERLYGLESPICSTTSLCRS